MCYIKTWQSSWPFFPQFYERASKCWWSSRLCLDTDCQYNVWFIAYNGFLSVYSKWKSITCSLEMKSEKPEIDRYPATTTPPTPEGGIKAMEKTQTHQRYESWKYVCALYLGWSVALLLTIERRASARLVNKPIQDMGTLTAERTMVSGYTRGRLRYFQLR